MPAITIRKLSPEIHTALKLRASRNGRSTEAEIRDILQEAVQAGGQPDLAADLSALGRRFEITDEFENLRDNASSRIVSFE